MINTMSNLQQITVKAYLTHNDKETEIRRFCLFPSYNLFASLQECIQQYYSDLQGKTFKLKWKDEDGDKVTFSTDQELHEALKHTQPGHLKVFIQVENDDGEIEYNEVLQQEHVGVVCDICNSNIRGIRYKCVTCADFDLCKECESKGHHSEHEMLRICEPKQGTFRGWWENVSHDKGQTEPRVLSLKDFLPVRSVTSDNNSERSTEEAGSKEEFKSNGMPVTQVISYPDLTTFAECESEASGAPDATPETEAVKFQRRLAEAVLQMEAMGFKNEDGWLTQLLAAKNCDVGRVVNIILPQGHLV